MKPFYLILTVLLFLLMQAAVAPRIALGSVAPDFVALVVIFFALHRGPIAGATLGFVVGFIRDLGNPDLLGLGALAGSLLGYLVGHAGQKAFPDNALFLFGLFFAGVFGHEILYLIFSHWPRVDSAFVRIFAEALPSAVYTALLGLVADRIISLFGSRLERTLGKEGQQ